MKDRAAPGDWGRGRVGQVAAVTEAPWSRRVQSGMGDPVWPEPWGGSGHMRLARRQPH